MISLGYASVGNPLPGAGLGSQVLANVGVMVSQEVPFPGKLKLKGDMASKEAQAGFQQYQAVQLAVIRAAETGVLSAAIYLRGHGTPYAQSRSAGQLLKVRRTATRRPRGAAGRLQGHKRRPAFWKHAW
ncbi:MAG: hypothetical protein WDO73_09725 [Ignavibacteriota bacterium]